MEEFRGLQLDPKGRTAFSSSLHRTRLQRCLVRIADGLCLPHVSEANDLKPLTTRPYEHPKCGKARHYCSGELRCHRSLKLLSRWLRSWADSVYHAPMQEQGISEPRRAHPSRPTWCLEM